MDRDGTQGTKSVRREDDDDPETSATTRGEADVFQFYCGRYLDFTLPPGNAAPHLKLSGAGKS
jgi:hypothetical protein